jgi:hypothetical protein
LAAAALAAVGRGWWVFPCHGIRLGGGCTCGRPDCRHPGKHPRTARGHRDASVDPEVVRRWWGRWPDANIGVACEPSGLVVIDIDPRHGGAATWAAWVRADGVDLVRTVTSLTGGGGRHLYFRAAAGRSPRDGAGRLGAGVDVKARGYVLLPPSAHATGRRYRWLPGAGPDDRDVEPLPAALRNADCGLRIAGSDRDRAAIHIPHSGLEVGDGGVAALLAGTAEGGRNVLLFRLACRLRGGGMPEARALALVLRAAANCRPPYDRAAAAELTRRVYRTYPPGYRKS